MDNTTSTAAPLTRREAREIERRTGIRPVAAATAPAFRHDTGEIERNEVTALVSVLPTELVQRVAAPALPVAVDEVEVPEAFDGRGLTVRAEVPASLAAARRRRRAGGFAAAASVTALASVGLAGVGAADGTEHQASLLTAAAPAEAADAAAVDAEQPADSIAPSPQVEVTEATSSIQTIDSAALFGAVGEAPAPAVAASGGGTPAPASIAPPAGPLADAIVSAAYAQLGITQDCTDMVQNALAAVGLTTRRDQGGYDYGVAAFERHGYRVSPDQVQPGDILISYGYHVAIYVGDGVNHLAVHGGWNGDADDTVVSSQQASPYFYDTIIRVG